MIDLVLAGHDHFYAHHFVNQVHILRSGTDFRQLSYIEARRKEDKQAGWDFDIVRRDIVRAIPEDKDTLDLVERLTSTLKEKLEKPIGYTAMPLDGRFTTVRTKESNLGNFVCDLMRQYYNAECTIMAAGTIRGDQIYPPGVLQLKDIMNCFPFEDPVVVLRVSGKNILSALENSVSLVPALEGRYPQVSNIQFEYDPSSVPGSRILWTKIDNEPLDLARKYVLATRGYMGRGKDGYDSLLIESEGGEAEEIVSEENGILISMILRQFFMSLKILGRWRRWGPHISQYWNGVQERLNACGDVLGPDNPKEGGEDDTKRNPKIDAKSTMRLVGHRVDSDSEDENVGENDIHNSLVPTDGYQRQREKHVARTTMKKWMRKAGVRRESVGVVPEEQSSTFVPHWTKAIAPRLVPHLLVIQQHISNPCFFLPKSVYIPTTSFIYHLNIYPSIISTSQLLAKNRRVNSNPLHSQR